MAKRKFELPRIQDLSKEQEAARALCKEGRHLIVGGPGTGKSVLALIRARRHQRERDDYPVPGLQPPPQPGQRPIVRKPGLVSRYLGQAGSGTHLREAYAGQSVPVARSRTTADTEEIDWAGVEEIVQAMPDDETTDSHRSS